ncbi:MAG TPA: hypothetical protein VGH82_12670 [Gaiellaceae bacterium]|jgi:hypothetical protein
MKRHKFFLLLAASGSAIALLVYPATLAAANGKPTKVAITDEQQTFDLPAGVGCSFELAGTPVSNKEYFKTYPADANGDVRTLINGTSKEQLTNVGTGKSIIVNNSGPSKEIDHADGSADVDIGGSVLVIFEFPFNPRGPSSYIYTGHTVLSFSPIGVLTVVSTTDNNPFDVCAALS